MSKMHKGMSESYKYKLRRRDEREQEREVLTEAKQEYFQEFGEGRVTYRSKLNAIKSKLMKKKINKKDI
jgi:hypothetical protein